jgi:TonB family protein
MMMIVAAWLVYCGVIAAVLTVGAYAWEVSARWSGRPARWGWLAAMAGSVTLPWLLRYAPAPVWGDVVPTALPALPSAAVVPFDAALFGGEVVQTAGGWTLLTYAVAGWVLLSLLMLLYVGSMLVSLTRARRRWRSTELAGGPVWLSRDMGPAAIGLREGVVVVPSWALSLPTHLRDLLLAHEREHVKAGDPRLLFASLLCVASMPWNPLLWLQLLRLRNAIELDCDARVLARGADPRSYGSLLLEVGSRRSSSPLVMATFAEPRLFLEERIRRIARYPLQRSRGRAVVFALAALVLFTTALSARDPLRPVSALGAGSFTVAPVLAEPVVYTAEDLTPLAPMPIDTPVAGARIEDGPTFTPMTVRPELRNQNDVQRALVASYPPMLRDAGIGGTPVVWFLIDEDGMVRRTQLSRTSGFPALDHAALDVASVMQFSPALNRDKRVMVWVEIPIVFTARGGRSPEEAAARARAAEAEALRAARAAGGAVTIPPPPETLEAAGVRGTPAGVGRAELANTAAVLAMMERNYPPLLRDAGIGGVTVVWFFVDESGRVLRTQIATSSGHQALDEAAISAASAMRFVPVTQNGRPRQAWVEMPVVFGAARGIPYTQSQGEIFRHAPLVIPGPGQSRTEATRVPLARAAAQEATRAAAQEATRAAAQQSGTTTAAPAFTPMTVRPELRNAADVQRALVRTYPPMLRDAGIGGTAIIWVFVDEKGTVQRTQLGTTAGYPALDEAALSVAGHMEFTPARNRNEVVAVWIQVPVIFSAR